MTFTLEITKELQRKLDPAHIKGRVGSGGVMLDYLEAWHAIAEANRIFGHDGWIRETLDLQPVGDVFKTTNGKYKIGYRATVRITVGDVIRDGTGFGNGIGSDPVDIHELAAKEAETDAMKRALATFGNPFGLALYDKKRANVGVDEPEAEPQAAPPKVWAEYLPALKTEVEKTESIESLDGLLAFHKTNLQWLASNKKVVHDRFFQEVITPHRVQLQQLQQPA